MTVIELEELLELLTDAPSTAKEIAALMEISDRRAQVGIWQLTYSKRARIVGAVPNPDYPRLRCRKTLKLYSAAEKSAGSDATGARSSV